MPTIEVTVGGCDLVLETDDHLFSPKRADRGTLAMVSRVIFTQGQRVLDLGCGYGLVGILAAKSVGEENVVMLDIDATAVRIAAHNANRNGVPGILTVESNGFAGLTESGFDHILSNPPYHTDFSVAKSFILKGFNRLNIGGTMWMVTKRSTWYRNKLRAVFGNAREHSVDGYCVFEATRKSGTYANAKKRNRRR